MRRRTYLRAAGVGYATSVAGCLTRANGGAPFLLGTYPGTGTESSSRLPAFERWLGVEHAVEVSYVNANLDDAMIDEFVATHVDAAWQNGHVPMVTWLPYLGTAAATPTDVERRIAAGEYDRFVDRWARRLGRWLDGGDDGDRRRLYFRPLPEMNGDWLPWSASNPDDDPGDFVRAWRRVYGRFEAEGLTDHRVAWVWNPNGRETTVAPTEEYYPGDGYVDWIGVDGYNWGDSQAWSTWTAPEDVFDSMVTRMRALADKPIALPEFGSTSRRNGQFRPAAKARWIAAAFEYVREAEVGMACWFNLDKETDWAVFGGHRGTGTYRHAGVEYAVYPPYRRAARSGAAVEGGRDDGTILTDEQFTGSFE